jgi:hypothetical protein
LEKEFAALICSPSDFAWYPWVKARSIARRRGVRPSSGIKINGRRIRANLVMRSDLCRLGKRISRMDGRLRILIEFDTEKS